MNKVIKCFLRFPLTYGVGLLQKISPVAATKLMYFKATGAFPNLKNPQTYCEKIQWLKLNHNTNDNKVIQRADKYAVRDFIIEKGFPETLVTLLGVWSKPEDIDWKKLPERFILKINNASGPDYIWLVNDRSKFSVADFEVEVRARLKHRYGENTGEFHYSKMPTKIIAEQLLEDEGRPLKDYKFYCFDGRVEFLSIEEKNPNGRHVRDYYAIDGSRHHVKFFNDLPTPDRPYTLPDNFNKMIHMAESLSQSYPHIRVDLYNLNGHVFFGEMTYTPENGMTAWNPRSLDLVYGKLMNINAITH
jgi:hypothetical protein